MTDAPKNKSLTQKVCSLFKALGAALGIVGGFLGIASFVFSCQQSAVQERRACLDSTSSFPLGLRSNALDMTEAVLRWSVTPEISRAREAKKTSIIFQLQLQSYESSLAKYGFKNAALITHKSAVEKIIDSIKYSKPNDEVLEKYLDSVENLMSQPPPDCPLN